MWLPKIQYLQKLVKKSLLLPYWHATCQDFNLITESEILTTTHLKSEKTSQGKSVHWIEKIQFDYKYINIVDFYKHVFMLCWFHMLFPAMVIKWISRCLRIDGDEIIWMFFFTNKFQLKTSVQFQAVSWPNERWRILLFEFIFQTKKLIIAACVPT